MKVTRKYYINNVVIKLGAFQIVARVANLLQAYHYSAVVVLRLATLNLATIGNAPIKLKLIAGYGPTNACWVEVPGKIRSS